MTIKANGFKTASMEEVSYDNAQPYLEAFQKVIKIPNGYSFHSVNKIKADDVQAYLFRFEKSENKGMNGEHYSFEISEKDKQVLGFTNMDKRYSNTKMLSKSETEKLQKTFC